MKSIKIYRTELEKEFPEFKKFSGKNDLSRVWVSDPDSMFILSGHEQKDGVGRSRLAIGLNPAFIHSFIFLSFLFLSFPFSFS